VAVLGIHNVVVHRALPAPADAALNLLTAAVLTVFAWYADAAGPISGSTPTTREVGLRMRRGAGTVVALAPSCRRPGVCSMTDARWRRAGRSCLPPRGADTARHCTRRGTAVPWVCWRCSASGAHRPPPCCGPRCCSASGRCSRHCRLRRQSCRRPGRRPEPGGRLAALATTGSTAGAGAVFCRGGRPGAAGRGVAAWSAHLSRSGADHRRRARRAGGSGVATTATIQLLAKVGLAFLVLLTGYELDLRLFREPPGRWRWWLVRQRRAGRDRVGCSRWPATSVSSSRWGGG
jgi:hypothetical protein